MKIALVQTAPIRGDLAANLLDHERWVHRAADLGAEWVFFPELSLTGYEPSLARELAMDVDSVQLQLLQVVCNQCGIGIGVGLPTPGETGVHISLAVFQPYQPRQVYHKHYLHPDEWAFFVAGDNLEMLRMGEERVALAICYELSVKGHAERAVANGATLYLASVAKSEQGLPKAIDRMAGLAWTHSILIMMVNCVGEAEDMRCAGGTAAWDRSGRLTGQLSATEPGMLVVDTELERVV